MLKILVENPCSWGVCGVILVENPCSSRSCGECVVLKILVENPCSSRSCGECVVLKILVENPCRKSLFMSSTQRTPHAPSCQGEREGGRDPVFGFLAARSLRDRGFSGFGPQGARDAGKTHHEASKVSCKAHASFCARLEPSCKKSEYFERAFRARIAWITRLPGAVHAVLAFGPWPENP